MCSISFVIPTFNRLAELQRTLGMLGGYDRKLLGDDDAEIIVVDNHSPDPVNKVVAGRLPNGLGVEVIRLDRNMNTAGRNIGVEHAKGEWIGMLDDDSAPIGGDFGWVLESVPEDIAAIGGEIMLPDGTRESGGLPEVFIGCGCAIRRDAYLQADGYDEAFGYYCEEYDLSAKLIALGYRIVHTQQLRFLHRKVQSGRDFGNILFRLVRNHAWVIARHAPDSIKQPALDALYARYRMIAEKEQVVEAYERAIKELESTIENQPNRPMSIEHWRRFIGAWAVERSFESAFENPTESQIYDLVSLGKGADVIEETLIRMGMKRQIGAPLKIIGTLSPGPMLDAKEQTPDAKMAWSWHDVRAIAP